MSDRSVSGRAFAQVDVFSDRPFGGNPVAVVLDAAGIDDAAMARFARWTNLSETTFVLPPTPRGAADGADYRLRIFTPGGELPFAGHPTLGSAHAWREAGGVPRRAGAVVQECGAGLVELREADGVLWFAAPPLVRSGPVGADDLAAALRHLGIGSADVVDAAWVDNGPGWLGVLLASADAVLALRPDPGADPGTPVTVIGPHAPGADAAFEVRAFVGGLGVAEDPVTGSANASLAQWLVGSGRAPARYTAAQGTALGRSGRVRVDASGDRLWVGGATRTAVTGVLEGAPSSASAGAGG